MQVFRQFHLVGLGLFLLLFSNFAIAATPQTKTVTCGGADSNQKQEQKGLIRAKRDNSTWVYNLVAGGDLKLKDVVWSYPGKGAVASGWGVTAETVVQAEKHYRLAWTSPLTTDTVANTGNFKVKVTGKRVCPGGSTGPGPAGQEETFEVTWDTDVVGIKIKRGNIDITDPQPNPQSVKVGEIVSLTTELEGAPPNANLNHQWSVPGIFHESWSVTQSTTTLVEATTNASDISFYWVDGVTNRQVSYAPTVNGEVLPAVTATFEIERPNITGQIDISGKFTVYHDGIAPILSNGQQGRVDQTGNILQKRHPGFTVYNVVITDPQGTVEFAQKVNSSIRRKLIDDGTLTGKWIQYSPTSGGDRYPWPSSNAPDPLHEKGPNLGLFAEDSPAQYLVGDKLGGNTTLPLKELTVQDSFTMWLMYNPSTPDAMLVPLMTISWGGAMSAKRDGGNWVPGSVDFATSGPVVLKPAYTYPVWSNGATENPKWE